METYAALPYMVGFLIVSIVRSYVRLTDGSFLRCAGSGLRCILVVKNDRLTCCFQMASKKLVINSSGRSTCSPTFICQALKDCDGDGTVLLLVVS